MLRVSLGRFLWGCITCSVLGLRYMDYKVFLKLLSVDIVKFTLAERKKKSTIEMNYWIHAQNLRSNSINEAFINSFRKGPDDIFFFCNLCKSVPKSLFQFSLSLPLPHYLPYFELSLPKLLFSHLTYFTSLNFLTKQLSPNGGFVDPSVFRQFVYSKLRTTFCTLKYKTGKISSSLYLGNVTLKRAKWRNSRLFSRAVVGGVCGLYDDRYVTSCISRHWWVSGSITPPWSICWRTSCWAVWAPNLFACQKQVCIAQI